MRRFDPSGCPAVARGLVEFPGFERWSLAEAVDRLVWPWTALALVPHGSSFIVVLRQGEAWAAFTLSLPPVRTVRRGTVMQAEYRSWDDADGDERAQILSRAGGPQASGDVAGVLAALLGDAGSATGLTTLASPTLLPVDVAAAVWRSLHAADRPGVETLLALEGVQVRSLIAQRERLLTVRACWKAGCDVFFEAQDPDRQAAVAGPGALRAFQGFQERMTPLLMEMADRVAAAGLAGPTAEQVAEVAERVTRLLPGRSGPMGDTPAA